MIDEERVNAAVACGDCDDIPKVEGAGEIFMEPKGTVQVMHNGIRILVDSHYGTYNTEIIRRLRGHHEPQEERAFFEVLPGIQRGATIMELGSFWAYYSLWFLSAVPEANAILVEPLESSLEAGRGNFEINQKTGTFIRAAIGNAVQSESAMELWPGMVTNVQQTSVDALMEHYHLTQLALLHADIQGAEVRMLQGAARALKTATIDWVFISTHGENIHQKCKSILKSHAYAIVAEHTPAESCSVDGLIVASAKHRKKIHISKRTSWNSRKAKLRSMIRVRILETLHVRAPTV